MDTDDPTPPQPSNVVQLHPDGSRPGEIDKAEIRNALANGTHDLALKAEQESRQNKSQSRTKNKAEQKPAPRAQEIKILILFLVGVALVFCSAFSWFYMAHIQEELGHIPLDQGSQIINQIGDSIGRRSTFWFFAFLVFLLLGMAGMSITALAFIIRKFLK